MKKNVMEETDFIVKKMSCQEKQKNGVRLQHLSSERNEMKCTGARLQVKANSPRGADNRHDDHEAAQQTAALCANLRDAWHGTPPLSKIRRYASCSHQDIPSSISNKERNAMAYLRGG
jgi:hypothetical protein